MTQEEKEIKEAFKKKTVEYLPAADAKKYRDWARTQAKDKLISLRISNTDLSALKARAASKGKKYQTYIGEILKREIQKAV